MVQMVTLPDDNQAHQFATMLQAGLPASQAILYFIESDDPLEITQAIKKWSNSRAVRRAAAKLMGRDWTAMSTDERAKYALDIHYSQLATLLTSVNYTEANAGEKGKMDSARVALEAKLAGQAGKGDALTSFFDDVRSGRIKLPSSTVANGRANQ